MGHHGLERVTAHPYSYSSDEVISMLEDAEDALFNIVAAKWRADRAEAVAAIYELGREVTFYKEQADNLENQLDDEHRELADAERAKERWQIKAEENEDYKFMYERLS